MDVTEPGEVTVPVAMTGPAVYAALDRTGSQRGLFTADYLEAIDHATRTRDICLVAEVVRSWWERLGGDPQVSAADRVAEHPDEHAVYDALGPADRVRYAGEVKRALEVAALNLDHRPVEELIISWAPGPVRTRRPRKTTQINPRKGHIQPYE